MPHDFLLSFHEGVEPEPKGASAGEGRGAARGIRAKGSELPEPEMPIKDDRHRTVGISMSPQLRDEAAARAKSLGLPLSRYVQWCIEAELKGVLPAARFERHG